jgi:hypothetical protein
MEVLGGGQGVVLVCDTPIMVRWDDGVYIVLQNDKQVIYYDPAAERMERQRQAIQEILDNEARLGR